MDGTKHQQGLQKTTKLAWTVLMFQWKIMIINLLFLGMQCKYAFFKTIKQKRTIVYGLIANFALNRYGSGTYTYQKFSFENGNGKLSRRTNYFGIEITYSIFNKLKNEIQNP